MCIRDRYKGKEITWDFSLKCVTAICKIIEIRLDHFYEGAIQNVVDLLSSTSFSTSTLSLSIQSAEMINEKINHQIKLTQTLNQTTGKLDVLPEKSKIQFYADDSVSLSQQQLVSQIKNQAEQDSDNSPTNQSPGLYHTYLRAIKPVTTTFYNTDSGEQSEQQTLNKKKVSTTFNNSQNYSSIRKRSYQTKQNFYLEKCFQSNSVIYDDDNTSNNNNKPLYQITHNSSMNSDQGYWDICYNSAQQKNSIGEIFQIGSKKISKQDQNKSFYQTSSGFGQDMQFSYLKPKKLTKRNQVQNKNKNNDKKQNEKKTNDDEQKQQQDNNETEFFINNQHNLKDQIFIKSALYEKLNTQQNEYTPTTQEQDYYNFQSNGFNIHRLPSDQNGLNLQDNLGEKSQKLIELKRIKLRTQLNSANQTFRQVNTLPNEREAKLFNNQRLVIQGYKRLIEKVDKGRKKVQQIESQPVQNIMLQTSLQKSPFENQKIYNNIQQYNENSMKKMMMMMVSQSQQQCQQQQHNNSISSIQRDSNTNNDSNINIDSSNININSNNNPGTTKSGQKSKNQSPNQTTSCGFFTRNMKRKIIRQQKQQILNEKYNESEYQELLNNPQKKISEQVGEISFKGSKSNVYKSIYTKRTIKSILFDSKKKHQEFISNLHKRISIDKQ
eukprot:TRINITY_DN4413_c0_g1_i8.p1 TRINITY_DN4413_c0_g1~~TRINITY_DN4413_c0_g1_i8.p1  ORF type:complete len:663 (-),score=144.90 TRINITY_DN4413_c0_g1_i8:155-2143(-)